MSILLLIFLIVAQGNQVLSQQSHDTVFDRVYDFMVSLRTDTLLGLESLIPDEVLPRYYEVTELLNNETRPICDTCITFGRTIKTLAATFEWEELQEPLVNACKWLLTNQSDEYINVDVLCPGIIEIQGPHVYEIARPIHRKSAEDICISLNACLPPPDDVWVQSHKQRSQLTYRPDPATSSSISKEHLTARKQAAVKIIQLTDIHIEPEYAVNSTNDCGLPACCVEIYGPGDAGTYGDYKCNIPERTMELFFQKINEIQAQFVIYSGDSPPHTMWEETIESQLNCTAIVIEAMSRILPGYRVYPNIGNHEMYPTNLYSMTYLPDYTGPMNDAFVSLWQPLSHFTEESIATMKQGGYYSQVIFPGLRIVSFNTNYWYTANYYNVLNDEEIATMFNFLETSFQNARDNGEKVILVGHHPPGGDAIIYYSRLFEDLLVQYGDLIMLHMAGHTHDDHYKVYSNTDGEPVSMAFINPSVTTRTNNNPSMRVYYIDDVTFQLIDYEQYGFLLNEVIEHQRNGLNNPPEIELWYSAMEEYGLVDMSPASWKDLSDRMQIDDDLFAKYYANHVTRYQGATCSESCRKSTICDTQFYSYDDYLYCTELQDLNNNTDNGRYIAKL